uniref:Uncharacterized protein n=1 Tax=Anopheles albimanus TaxID=7167 RepID=A0A182FSM5_ANOAL
MCSPQIASLYHHPNHHLHQHLHQQSVDGLASAAPVATIYAATAAAPSVTSSGTDSVLSSEFGNTASYAGTTNAFSCSQQFCYCGHCYPAQSVYLSPPIIATGATSATSAVAPAITPPHPVAPLSVLSQHPQLHSSGGTNSRSSSCTDPSSGSSELSYYSASTTATAAPYHTYPQLFSPVLNPHHHQSPHPLLLQHHQQQQQQLHTLAQQQFQLSRHYHQLQQQQQQSQHQHTYHHLHHQQHQQVRQFDRNRSSNSSSSSSATTCSKTLSMVSMSTIHDPSGPPAVPGPPMALAVPSVFLPDNGGSQPVLYQPAAMSLQPMALAHTLPVGQRYAHNIIPDGFRSDCSICCCIMSWAGAPIMVLSRDPEADSTPPGDQRRATVGVVVVAVAFVYGMGTVSVRHLTKRRHHHAVLYLCIRCSFTDCESVPISGPLRTRTEAYDGAQITSSRVHHLAHAKMPGVVHRPAHAATAQQHLLLVPEGN